MREEATKSFAGVPVGVDWWAFRIVVRKSGQRAFDIENVPKPIIDAFCARQIRSDGSPHGDLGLYSDDSLDHVRFLQVYGERCSDADSTSIQIFGHLEGAAA